MESVNFESLVEKWAPVLNEETAGPISDRYKKQVTAAILENQEQAMMSENSQGSFLAETPANATGSVSNWDPVLISLVRRAMPNLMAYDVCGVQPMSGPTGLIFAMKSQYKTTVAGVTAAALRRRFLVLFGVRLPLGLPQLFSGITESRIICIISIIALIIVFVFVLPNSGLDSSSGLGRPT